MANKNDERCSSVHETKNDPSEQAVQFGNFSFNKSRLLQKLSIESDSTQTNIKNNTKTNHSKPVKKSIIIDDFESQSLAIPSIEALDCQNSSRTSPLQSKGQDNLNNRPTHAPPKPAQNKSNTPSSRKFSRNLSIDSFLEHNKENLIDEQRNTNGLNAIPKSDQKLHKDGKFDLMKKLCDEIECLEEIVYKYVPSMHLTTLKNLLNQYKKLKPFELDDILPTGQEISKIHLESSKCNSKSVLPQKYVTPYSNTPENYSNSQTEETDHNSPNEESKDKSISPKISNFDFESSLDDEMLANLNEMGEFDNNDANNYDDFNSPSTVEAEYAPEIQDSTNYRQNQPNQQNYPEIIISQESHTTSTALYDSECDPALSQQQIAQNTQFQMPKEIFPFTHDLMNSFRNTFGLKNFRKNQLECINSFLNGKDCFVLMPTGGGKSLCYQLPASINRGVTIVISPLKSLITDQVSKLQMLGIKTAQLTSEVDYETSKAIFADLRSGCPTFRMVYLTPEKIKASEYLLTTFEKLYENNLLSMFVIDECHCVSQWGHDFRPDYKELHLLRKNFPRTKMMALTATATPRVREDILYQLNMKNPVWFVQSFNRSNLKYSIVPKTRTILTDILRRLKPNGSFYNKSGIIYCLSRKECESVSNFLRKNNIKSNPYHAGLSDEDRNSIQEAWINEDDCKIVCATIAFGMGIDKPDVRFVMHYSLPKSIEGYYQETGRAGRDNLTSHCILYYTYSDSIRMAKIFSMEQIPRDILELHEENLKRVVQYAENRIDCRRAMILNYFGENFDPSECKKNKQTTCDNCVSHVSHKEKDFTDIAQIVVKAIRQNAAKGYEGSFTMLHYIEVFKGSMARKILDVKHDKLAFFGAGRAMERTNMERFFSKLIVDGFLAEKHQTFRKKFMVTYIVDGPKADLLLNNCLKFTMSIAEHTQRDILGTESDFGDSISVRTGDSAPEQLPEARELINKCFNSLVSVAKSIAKDHNKRYTTIFPILMLRQLSTIMPTCKEMMLSHIDGMTENFYNQYFGERFLSITTAFSEKMPQTAMPKIQSASKSDLLVPGSTRNLRSNQTKSNSVKEGKGWIKKNFSPTVSGSKGKKNYGGGRKGGGGRSNTVRKTKNSTYNPSKAPSGNQSAKNKEISHSHPTNNLFKPMNLSGYKL